jgi:hypothetical protein
VVNFLIFSIMGQSRLRGKVIETYRERAAQATGQASHEAYCSGTTLKMEVTISFEKSVTINQHRIITQKPVVFIIGAIKEQNLL